MNPSSEHRTGTSVTPNTERARHLYSNRYLLGGLVVLVLLSNIPFGQYVLYPFELFSTWIHEVCHGLAALAVGGTFDELRLFSDTSGQALSNYVTSRPNLIIVASAGYIGTSFFGALLLILQRPTRFSRSLAAMTMAALGFLVMWHVQPISGIIIYLFITASIGLLAFASPTQDIGRFGVFSTGCGMLLTLLYARNLFTIATLFFLGGLLVLLGIRGSATVANFVFSLLAATCGLNAVTSINSLFATDLTVNGQSVASSDAHAVASYMFGSYQLWAAIWLVFSILLLGWSLWHSVLSPSVNRAIDPDIPETHPF